jgi:hypothetical protein
VAGRCAMPLLAPPQLSGRCSTPDACLQLASGGCRPEPGATFSVASTVRPVAVQRPREASDAALTSTRQSRSSSLMGPDLGWRRRQSGRPTASLGVNARTSCLRDRLRELAFRAKVLGADSQPSPWRPAAHLDGTRGRGLQRARPTSRDRREPSVLPGRSPRRPCCPR